MSLLSATNLASDGSFSHASSFNTASITPKPKTLYALVVANRNNDSSAPSTPSISGNGITWTQIQTAETTDGVPGRVTLFVGWANAPTTGAITINCSVAQHYCMWSVNEIKTSDVNTATIQPQGGNTSSANPSLTLSAFSNVNNGVIAACSTIPGSAISQGANFTELSTNSSTGVLCVEFAPNNQTSVAFVASAAAFALVATELRALITKFQGGVI